MADGIGSVVQDEIKTPKSEIVWGKPLTDSDVLTILNVVRLWSSEQVPAEADPWLWKCYMDLAHSTEPVIDHLEFARPNLPEDLRVLA